MLVLAGALANGQTITETFGSGANQFSIDFVTIGNLGNVADTTGYPNPGGSVPYIYNLGKYEVSRDMVLKASTMGGLGLTLQDMTSYGGNGQNRPATGISWNEAARFVNWLNTSKGYQAAYNLTTSGPNDNILLWGAGQYSGSNRYRNKDAVYFLPSVDEWYKAAYGSPNGTWHKFTTGSNSAPLAVSNGTTAGTVVYGGQLGPADITDAGGESPFGTMGQGGNVHEWNETAFDGLNDSATEIRLLRGGTWMADSFFGSEIVGSSVYFGISPSDERNTVGFRIAMIPEPSSFSLLLAGGAVLMAGRRRRV